MSWLARCVLIVVLALAHGPLVLAATPVAEGKTAADFDAGSVLIVHYHRPKADYDGWNVWVWPAEGAGQPISFTERDAFGPYAIVRFPQRHEQIGFIVRRGDWAERDIGYDRYIEVDADGVAEVWLVQDRPAVHTDPRGLRYRPQKIEPAPPRRVPDKAKITRVAQKDREVSAGAIAVIHYHRPDGRYGDWDVWAWPEGGEGRAYALNREDEFGRYATIELSEPAARVGFILRKRDWSGREPGGDRYVELDERGVGEAWVVAGDRRVYADPEELDFRPKVVAAFLDASDRVVVRLSEAAPVQAWAVSDLSAETAAGVRRVAAVRPVNATLFGAEEVELRLESPVTPEELRGSIHVALPGFAPAPVHPRDVLAEPAHVALDAHLGYAYGPEGTTFRTWSPVAERVELLLFADAQAAEPERVVELKPRERGLWEARVGGDLHGTYYAYRVTRAGKTLTMADVHGYAATKDSARSLVLDLRRTDPEGFREHKPPTVAHATDEVIYELHVRDFSIHDDQVPPEHRGKYLGLTYETKGKTSLAHLKAMGVTTVHLLPIQDFTSSMDEYNWGYWTALFNVPEAQYSTTPDDPANTIRELKQAIQALHGAGIRVVMDVVYNHTSSSFEASPFDGLVPWHYFRSDSDGTYRNESGTGNAFADERPMARKYIVDSLKFWLAEYQVDGFRFDLMGMHEPETMRQIERELRAIREDVLLYGEPWTGGGPTRFGKGAQRGTRIAVFNDHLRNAIRGDLDGDARGFAMGGSHADAIRKGVMASLDDFADSPTETINYVSAHDNLSLWDKVEEATPGSSESQRIAMNKLALGIVLTAQGVPFLHGGSEFGYTKDGHHNTYNLGDEVNAFDWPRRDRYRDMAAWVAGVVRMRREHPVFRMHRAEDVRKNLQWLPSQDVVAYALNGAAVGDAWGRVIVAYNGREGPRRLALPEGAWRVVVDAERAGVAPLRWERGAVTLPGYSMVVLVQE